MRTEIENQLEEIEKAEDVRILYAVESGSRAWGVESPDSDFDVRFIYVKNKEYYLELQEKRDVIEWQLDEVLDINGWDLRKTMVQFHKGNATLFEWANSPIVYRTTDEWDKIYEASKMYFSEKAALYHYYGTAKSTYMQYLKGDKVKYKKYFYALRPLLACRYIENNHMIPPVRFDDLLKQNLPDGLKGEIDELLFVKAKSDEGELNRKLPTVQRYIEDEISRYEQLSKTVKDDRTKDWEALNRVFLDVL